MQKPGSHGGRLAWARAGLWAGAAVGLIDGARAALAIGADAGGTCLAALLAASVDACIGVVIGAGCDLVVALRRWGRRARPSPGFELAAGSVMGALAALLTALAIVGTAERRSRFLAAGIIALVAGAGGVLGALAIPALARLLSLAASRGVKRPAAAPARPNPLSWLAVPLTLAGAAAAVFGLVLRMRPPPPLTLRAASVSARLAPVLGVAASLPLLTMWTSGLRLGRWRLGVRATAALTAMLFASAGAVFTGVNWERSLRFLPWTHVLVGAALAGVALLAKAIGDGRGAWGFLRSTRSAAALAVLAVAAVFVTSESEPARKAVFARAGLVAPVLMEARHRLDRDGDGYARWLGGGDCDDGDATIHPGVLDYPDDGVDEDCDGRDAHAATLASPPFGPVPASVPRELNLLLVTIDTLRADHLGAYGYPRPTSPELDRLAREGSLFVNGWAHAPSTRYSMPAIATGRWPSSIPWDESIWWPRIGPEARTLGQALKAAGYFTAAFYSFEYFALADHRGFERGIDLYRADRAALHRSINGPMESRGSSSRQMADDAIAFFEAHAGEKWFLWLHFYDPHLSYEPHAEVSSFGRERVDLYDGEIRFTDLHLGRLLRRLEELGQWGRTAVLVTGDHGEGFGEHGVSEHGFDLYAAQTKVPFIVRVPGLPPSRPWRPVGHVDIAPTLLNLARAPQEPSFLGRSLVPELAAGDARAEETSSGDGPVVFQEVTSERGKKRALVSRDRQVIWNWTPDNTTECYDLGRDPAERRDVWGRADAPECARLKQRLQEMVSLLSLPPGIGAKLAGSVFPPGGPPPPGPRTSLAVQIGDDVRVAGVSASAATVRAGQVVDVDVHLECTRPIPPGWRPFFHLVGEGGFFRNLDHVPVQGAMPLDRWKPGLRIVDRFQVAIPAGAAPGRYRLLFGLFEGAARQPVLPEAASDGKRAVRLLELRLE